MRRLLTLTLLASITLPLVAAAADVELTAQRLFHIERNKNANIVVYDAMVQPDGNLPEKDKHAIEVYWLKQAEGGERKGLKRIERKKAYGFKVKEREGNRVVIEMVADIGRLITVNPTESTYQAFVDINGRQAVMEKVFIFATEGGLLPTVEYIELFGKDLETGEDAYEKFLP
jgi:hypothetical protein